MFTFENQLHKAEEILDNTPVALYIEPAKTIEQEIWFLKEIRHLPYPVQWFESDAKRTHAMYKQHYKIWQKEFVKQHVTYMKAKKNWEYYYKKVEEEKEEASICWPS